MSSEKKNSVIDQLKEALSEPPVPRNPQHFLGTLYFSEIEDETGNMPAALEHIGKIGSIPLQTTIDEARGVIVLSGESNPDAHPIHRVAFAAGHKGGMTFMVKSTNQNHVVRHFDLWKRSFTKKQMETVVAEVDVGEVKMSGHCPYLPFGTGVGRATFTLEDCRGSYFIQKANIEVDFKTYDAWVWLVTH